MNSMLGTLTTAARKRVAYYRTVAAIEAMSPDVALDLDVDRASARTIARRAVYGA